MAEGTRRTVINVQGLDLTGNVLVDSHSHVLSYGTSAIEGIPITLSLGGDALCIMEPAAHAARHLWGVSHLDPDNEEMQERLGDKWKPGISLDEAYRIARTDPAKFPLSVEIFADGGIKELTIAAYVKSIEDAIAANLDLPEDRLRAPNYSRPKIFRGDRQIGRRKDGEWTVADGGIGVADLQHAWEFINNFYQWPREYMGTGVFENGAKVYVAPHTRLRDEQATLAFLKIASNYGGLRTKLKNIAIKLGFNDCIIMGINKEEREVVTELTGANIFIIKGGTLITPPAYPESRMILPGITRDNILLLARIHADSFGISKIEERHFGLEELLNADEVFAVGSAAKVTPITEVSVLDMPTSEYVPNKIGNGTPGIITKGFQAAYFFMERGEMFAFVTNGKDGQKEIEVVDAFVPRVKKVEIRHDRREIVASQLGLIDYQTFDNRFGVVRRREAGRPTKGIAKLPLVH